MELLCRIRSRSVVAWWALASLSLVRLAQARPIQIIHTNDLHSHMERADALVDVGGFAAVKAKIDALKADADSRGIPTLVLDAGDFSEGTEFFFADEGQRSWKLVSEMGYDAVALGNHDYQMGTLALDRMLGLGFPGLNLLSANYDFESAFHNISRSLKPFAEFIRGGLKIAVLGLTTDELVYRWTAEPGAKVRSPIETAGQFVPGLAARNDAVIALTHIGVDSDIRLAEKVPGIGLVVGGHSHTILDEPVLAVNSETSRIVPIVQTGAHGVFVGDLLVDIEPASPVQVLRYRLDPVIPSQIGEDRAIADSVREARRALEARYGAEWLYATIAQSEVPLENPLPVSSRWGTLFAQAMRESAGAELGLDDGEFFGPTQPDGPVSREKLIQFYPRSFDPTHKLGWTVWTVKVHGAVLKEAVKRTFAAGSPLVLAGLTYDVSEKGGKLKFSNFRVDGSKLEPARKYRVATSEGLGRGTRLALHFLGKYFESKDTGVPVWTAVEQKLKAMGGVVKRQQLPE